jgi:hypothetical protein
MQGINGIPASSGPTPPIKFTPSHPPIMPTIAEVKNPPGTVFGTRRSARAAHTAATIKYKTNRTIDIIFLFNQAKSLTSMKSLKLKILFEIMLPK